MTFRRWSRDSIIIIILLSNLCQLHSTFQWFMIMQRTLPHMQQKCWILDKILWINVCNNDGWPFFRTTLYTCIYYHFLHRGINFQLFSHHSHIHSFSWSNYNIRTDVNYLFNDIFSAQKNISASMREKNGCWGKIG